MGDVILLRRRRRPAPLSAYERQAAIDTGETDAERDARMAGVRRLVVEAELRRSMVDAAEFQQAVERRLSSSFLLNNRFLFFWAAGAALPVWLMG